MNSRIEYPQKLLVMVYTCTLLVYPSEIRLKRHLSVLHIVKISHASIWNGIQKYKPKKKYRKNKKIKEYVIDKNAVKSGSELIWLWVVIEAENKEILSFYKSKERNMIVAERFLSKVVEEYGLHSVSTTDDGGTLPSASMQILEPTV